ncbi:MAG: hypothetical protein ACLGHZ_05905, partial [Actinomycetes bacterium]
MDAAILGPLLKGHWYDALSAVLDAEVRGGATGRVVEARDLATAAKRVLDLDAEDFASIAEMFPREEWKHELTDACFPTDPRSAERGALGS